MIIKGEEVILYLVVKFFDKFKVRFEVIKCFKKVVEDFYVRFEKVVLEIECCYVNKLMLKYSEWFCCKVDFDNVCMKIFGSVFLNFVYLDDGVF